MFLDGVFGTEMPFVVKFFLAFLLVLGLIGVGAWGLRRFTSGRLGGAGTRGRQPRLGVIDYASVDARRRLILVRRDNVEHLLMIGGPTDVVVEANIVRAVAAPRDVALARPAAAEPLPRAIPLPDNGNGSWPLQPEVITTAGASGAEDRTGNRRSAGVAAAAATSRHTAGTAAARYSGGAGRRAFGASGATARAGSCSHAGSRACAARSARRTARCRAASRTARSRSAGGADARGHRGRRSKPRRNGASPRSRVAQTQRSGRSARAATAPRTAPSATR